MDVPAWTSVLSKPESTKNLTYIGLRFMSIRIFMPPAAALRIATASLGGDDRARPEVAQSQHQRQ